MAVLGETGMGKSSLLVALARRVAVRHGLLLLDPIGDTADAVDRELGPKIRSRVSRICPVQAPVRLNALQGIFRGEHQDPVRSERRLNDLVHSLRRVRSGRYADSSFWGPRLEEMLTRAIRAAAALPSGTLEVAHTLLATGGRAPRDVPPFAMGPVQELAHRIRERPEDADGAQRLLYEIVRSPVLSKMLCASAPDLDASDLVRPGRIVLLSGRANEVGESTARYLLAAYLAIIWSEVLARPERDKTFLFLDEAQWYAHESLAEMLRLGRARNLHVVLATQSLGSLVPDVAEAVWTNVADFVAFRGSPAEAREIARASPSISVESLLSLPRGHAAVLLGKGESVEWLRTLRLPERSGAPARREDPAEGAGAPPHPPPETAEGRVLDCVRRAARETGTDGTFDVPLEDLRQRADPGGNAVRRVGSELAACGAIVASRRGESGTVWTLRTDRIPRANERSPSTAPLEDSSPPQPS